MKITRKYLPIWNFFKKEGPMESNLLVIKMEWYLEKFCPKSYQIPPKLVENYGKLATKS